MDFYRRLSVLKIYIKIIERHNEEEHDTLLGYSSPRPGLARLSDGDARSFQVNYAFYASSDQRCTQIH